MEKQFRQNAAVIIINSKQQVLLCERGFPGYAERTLQTVQGGIDPGETPQEAAERELCEELGVTSQDFVILKKLPETFSYEWPKEYIEESREKYPNNPYIGQEQHFFLARMRDDVHFNLDATHREFDRVYWGSAKELYEGVWEAKRPGISAALRGFGLMEISG